MHKTAASLMLCYVGRHDDAYAWAERRKIERHPQTGAAQLVEIRETVREIVVPKYVEATLTKPAPKPLFTDTPDWLFLSYGVPPEWMDDVRAATEETILDLADHLPREAAEALLNLATGTTLPIGPPPAMRVADAAPPSIEEVFQHPDAQSRFRVIESREELERALEAPWEKWTIFLPRIPSRRSHGLRRRSDPATGADRIGLR